VSTYAALKCALYLVIVVALALPLGGYMARVYEGRARLAQRVLGPVERLVYRACRVRADEEMTWKTYALAVLVFNLIGIFVVYLLQRAQHVLPLNPAALGPVAPELAWNTAVTFPTNCNWQAYGGETTLSYATQMLGPTVQNFASAATGMAVLVALVRGLTRRDAATIGNFWVDLTRSVVYVLVPASLVFAVVLVSQGVVQTFDTYATARLVEGARAADGTAITEQVIALGPAASQIAIKGIGTNGGGFFNVNSAHPFENPTPLSSALQMIWILLIPVAQCFTFGAMVKDRRQGQAVLAAMFVVFVPLLFVVVWAEEAGNPLLSALGAVGGNMEGKETRFGVVESAIWSTASSATSNGSVNAMNDSFTPIGGLVPMWLIQLGEVVFGGVGTGLYGMLVYVVMAVFVAGQLVGRSPEYLGKRIEAYEMKMAAITVLVPAVAILAGTALACSIPAGTGPLGNPGAHGFSEILYAFSSTSNNNGSAFAGITVSGTFYSVALGICIFVGRYWIIVPVLAIAGSLAKKKSRAPTRGTLPTHTPIFVALLVGIVVTLGALTFLPALALGPIVEHLSLARR
jgi:K+-transporting ATPase ATPase A chain